MQITVATTVTPELSAIWADALKALLRHRGGQELYQSQWGDRENDEVLVELVDSNSVFSVRVGPAIVGFAVVRRDVIEGLYVDPSVRRTGVARALVTSLLEGEVPVRDSLVLPGDRGMKSLFESFGWKARLLTMRGE